MTSLKYILIPSVLVLIAHRVCGRVCRDSSSDVRRITVEPSLTSTLELTEENELRIYAVANWTTDVSDYNFNLPLDGYAVRFHEGDVESILSHSPCVSNSTYLWVNKTGDPNCLEPVSDYSECGGGHPSVCECPLSNCSVLWYNRTCDDVNFYLNMGYQTVPATARNIRYPVKFNAIYQFDIVAYNRLYANGEVGTANIQMEILDCIGAAIRSTSIDISSARRFCCEYGAISSLPYGVNQTKVVPIFKSNANDTLVNVTITFFPPDVDPDASVSVTLHPFTSDKFIPRKIPITNQTNFNATNCSSPPPYYYEVVLYDLDPDVPHEVFIVASYNGSEEICTNEQCSTRFSLDSKVPDDLCRTEFGFCIADAECVYSYDQYAGYPNSTCVCGEGYYGDGTPRGTGCEEIDACEGWEKNCSDTADCKDFPPPSSEAACYCPGGYFGDGLREGSGCTADTTILLATVLPILFLIIIAAVCVWFIIRKRRQAKASAEMARFIADLYIEQGILSYYQDPETFTIEQQAWQPTFGPQRELDRNEVQFEEVLGRGNYGIVYKGYLYSGNHADKNEIHKNDGFYDLVKTSESFENAYFEEDNDAKVVAVKCLQESIHNHENLLNFMAEISFMFNVGSHENIVKIHGCSTTESPVFMVMEYLCYGDLLHFLWDAREPSKRENDPIYRVTETSLTTMAKDVAKGMVYLQQTRLIHGDIAARNILVGEEGICKLSDFGLSSDVYRYGHIKSGVREVTVPMKWTSPERMMGGKYPVTGKSDVWSYGNLLYEIFTLGCPPYPEVKTADLLDSLRSGYRMKQPKSCGDEMYELMSMCWRWRASSRPAFTQVLKHINNILVKSQSRQQEAFDTATAVEPLDKEFYENELKTAISLNGDTLSNGSPPPPYYENGSAAESAL